MTGGMAQLAEGHVEYDQDQDGIQKPIQYLAEPWRHMYKKLKDGQFREPLPFDNICTQTHWRYEQTKWPSPSD